MGKCVYVDNPKEIYAQHLYRTKIWWLAIKEVEKYKNKNRKIQLIKAFLKGSF
jgi:hypothetical protein